MGFTAEDSCLLLENQSEHNMWTKHSETNREINKALYGEKEWKAQKNICVDMKKHNKNKN